jgi:hypothetical protein
MIARPIRPEEASIAEAMKDDPSLSDGSSEIKVYTLPHGTNSSSLLGHRPRAGASRTPGKQTMKLQELDDWGRL